MKVVWKYRIPFQADEVAVMMPRYANIVHVEYVEYAEGSPTGREWWIWAEVDSMFNARQDEFQDRRFKAFSTGDAKIASSARYVACGIEWSRDHRERRTFPRWVWHLYELNGEATKPEGPGAER
jgi:hypothetical protein